MTIKVKELTEEQNNTKHRTPEERVEVVPREEWNARSAQGEIPDLVTPISKIVLTWTDTDPVPCEWPYECVDHMRDIQKDHMNNRNLPDIQYNFIIARTKQIYVGRGWTKQAEPWPDTIKNADQYNGQSITIAFVEKDRVQPSTDMIDGMSKLIALKMLPPDPLVVKPVSFSALNAAGDEFIPFHLLYKNEIEPLPTWVPNDPRLIIKYN